MDEEKISMAQSLREMAVNEDQTFVLVKKTSVVNTVQRLKSEGYRFKCKTYLNSNCLLVTKLVNPK